MFSKEQVREGIPTGWKLLIYKKKEELIMKISASFFLFLFLMSLTSGSNVALSADHPGTPVEPPKSTIEHPGKPAGQEHPGKAITADFVKKSIRQHVKSQAKSTKGVFVVHDERLNKDWHLKLLKVHDPVRTFEKDGMTIYFACSDFKSLETKDVLDIDFWMVPKGNKLEVIDTKIHKVNGEPRYAYEGMNIKEIK